VDAECIVGTTVAGYAIESVLGRGAMGIVYVARQRSPERRVALKLIAPPYANDDAFRRRFLREATAAAAIEHPHILPVYAAGESDGTLYLAMRLVDGVDLREVVQGSPGLELDRVASIVGQLGGALDAAHARGLVHRDVKPGNVLLTTQPDEPEPDFCYLTDFGVSTWTTSSAATITASGQMIGTANYVAPEQIEGGRIDGRADLYSLGCVLYECIAGRPPFAGRAPAATLYAHIHERAPSPSALRPDLPPGVDLVTDRALAKSPDERYATCRELAQDLRAALAGAAPAVRRVPLARSVSVPGPRVPAGAHASGERRRRTWILGVAAAAIVVAGGIAAAIASSDGPPPPDSSSPSVATAPLIRDGVGVTASDTAPASVDGAGNPVTYAPTNVIDGDVQTAWRTLGDGRGERVTLIFDNPIDVERIGLIPGYAKTDTETGANRFFQGRIIGSVRYLVPGLPPTSQTFRPEPVPQFVRLGVTTSRITVEILGTTEPGSLDYTAISEIYVYGYPQ
jgi:serine/threonine-protein kinase